MVEAITQYALDPRRGSGPPVHPDAEGNDRLKCLRETTCRAASMTQRQTTAVQSPVPVRVWAGGSAREKTRDRRCGGPAHIGRGI